MILERGLKIHIPHQSPITSFGRPKEMRMQRLGRVRIQQRFMEYVTKCAVAVKDESPRIRRAVTNDRLIGA
jgi:hypothetical protein